MELTVNGQTVSYDPDFDPVNIQENVKKGWRVFAGDYFKFPEKINGVEGIEFFIKRFNKKKEEISGYQLLQKIKGRKYTGLPIVFDVVHTVEANRQVIYLFLEFIKGDTLDNLHRDGFTFIPSRLGEDLFNGIKSIHDHGFWFPDFDPKNFLRSQTGEYFIIDLDSTYPLTALPAASMFGSKDFWAPTYEFYRAHGSFTSQEIKSMRGDVLNYLNLIYFMGLYSFYLDEHGDDLTAHSIAKLNKYLLGRHQLFSTTMIYCFYKDAETGRIIQRVPSLQVFRSFLKNVLFPEDYERRLAGAPAKPQIVYFTANGRETHDLEVSAGNKILLEWETRDTTSVRLLPQNRVLNNKGSLSIAPMEDVTYSLQGIHKFKTMSEAVTRSIDVNIFDPDIKKPVVDFFIEGYLQKAILLEGSEYTLQWAVAHAHKAFLDEAKVQLKDSRTYNAARSVSHTLRAINSRQDKTRKTTVIVEVEVEQRPEINLSVAPLVVKRGQAVTVSWQTNHASNVFIIQDGITINSQGQPAGSMEVVLEPEKSRASSNLVHFTASAFSLSGKWTVDTDDAQIVRIKNPSAPAWLIILFVVALLLVALWLYRSYYAGGS